MANSSKPRPARKPRKPHEAFPLFPHANGQWAKKIRGKLYYFGQWGDPDAALALWLEQKDDLLAGRKPRATRDGLTVRDLCNAFLTDRKHRLDAGDIVRCTFDDYLDTCERLLRHIDGNRLVDDLRPEDFTELRGKLAKRWSPNTLANEVQRVRVTFNYAYQAGLVDRPVRFGPTFKRPAKKVLRRARNEKGPRMFEAPELRRIIDAATQPLKAMVLLGANCGFGNADCAGLPIGALDLEGGWIDHPRPKTGIQRRCPLWPETIEALTEVLKNRKPPKDPAHAALVFVTKYGGAWGNPKDPSVITKEFRKVLDALELHRPGLGFYALRHTFETIGGDSRDQVAVDHIMGHGRDDMASVYRERIGDDRLRDVVGHVHAWLFGEGVAA